MKEGLNIQANTFPEDSQCKLIAILEQFGAGKCVNVCIFNLCHVYVTGWFPPTLPSYFP